MLGTVDDFDFHGGLSLMKLEMSLGKMSGFSILERMQQPVNLFDLEIAIYFQIFGSCCILGLF